MDKLVRKIEIPLAKKAIEKAGYSTEQIKIALSNKPVTVEIKDIRPRKTATKDELRVSLMTRVQGSNDRKNLFFGRKMPGYIKDAMNEIDAIYE